MSSKNSDSNVSGKQPLSEEQQAKISEIRKSLGQLPEKLSRYCSDASIARYLTARNWNVKKATKMLKDTLQWRLQYKPEEIRWEDIAHEAETGKIYRTNYFDKYGRSVLVMRPGCQNTKSTKGQIRYLVYCMENAILNLPSDQEQMVWLIDFHGFHLSNISIKVTKETAHVLQEHYPERLGVAILYNPPKFFEPFWTVAKPFLEPKTCNKVKFVYTDNDASKMIMEGLFSMDELESSFGGNNQIVFNIDNYATMMREDDKRMPLFWTSGFVSSEGAESSSSIPAALLDSNNPESNCTDSNQKFEGNLSSEHNHALECLADDTDLAETNGNGYGNAKVDERCYRSSEISQQ